MKRHIRPLSSIPENRQEAARQYRRTRSYLLWRTKAFIADLPIVGWLLFFEHIDSSGRKVGAYTFRPIHIWRQLRYEWACYRYDRTQRSIYPWW